MIHTHLELLIVHLYVSTYSGHSPPVGVVLGVSGEGPQLWCGALEGNRVGWVAPSGGGIRKGLNNTKGIAATRSPWRRGERILTRGPQQLLEPCSLCCPTIKDVQCRMSIPQAGGWFGGGGAGGGGEYKKEKRMVCEDRHDIYTTIECAVPNHSCSRIQG